MLQKILRPPGQRKARGQPPAARQRVAGKPHPAPAGAGLHGLILAVAGDIVLAVAVAETDRITAAAATDRALAAALARPVRVAGRARLGQLCQKNPARNRKLNCQTPSLCAIWRH